MHDNDHKIERFPREFLIKKTDWDDTGTLVDLNIRTSESMSQSTALTDDEIFECIGTLVKHLKAQGKPLKFRAPCHFQSGIKEYGPDYVDWQVDGIEHYFSANDPYGLDVSEA